MNILFEMRLCGSSACYPVRGKARNFPIVRAAIGSTYGVKGDLRRAATELDKAAAEHPVNAHALVNRGVVRARLGDAEAAEKDFALALKLQPSNAAARNNLAAVTDHRSGASAQAEAERAQPRDLFGGTGSR